MDAIVLVALLVILALVLLGVDALRFRRLARKELAAQTRGSIRAQLGQAVQLVRDVVLGSAAELETLSGQLRSADPSAPLASWASSTVLGEARRSRIVSAVRGIVCIVGCLTVLLAEGVSGPKGRAPATPEDEPAPRAVGEVVKASLVDQAPPLPAAPPEPTPIPAATKPPDVPLRVKASGAARGSEPDLVAQPARVKKTPDLTAAAAPRSAEELLAAGGELVAAGIEAPRLVVSVTPAVISGLMAGGHGRLVARWRGTLWAVTSGAEGLASGATTAPLDPESAAAITNRAVPLDALLPALGPLEAQVRKALGAGPSEGVELLFHPIREFERYLVAKQVGACKAAGVDLTGPAAGTVATFGRLVLSRGGPRYLITRIAIAGQQRSFVDPELKTATTASS